MGFKKGRVTRLFLNFRKIFLAAWRIHGERPHAGAGTGTVVTGMAWREGACVCTPLARGGGWALVLAVPLQGTCWSEGGHSLSRMLPEARIMGGTEKATVLS